MDEFSGDGLWTESTSSAVFTSEGNNATFQGHVQSQGLIEDILAGVLLPVNFYMMVVAGIYQHKCNQEGLRLSNTLLMVSAITQFIRIIFFEIELRVGHLSTKFCKAFKFITISAYFLGRLLPFVVLWLRQNRLNRSTLTSPHFKCIKIYSVMTLVGILCCQIAYSVFQLALVDMASSPSGCLYLDVVTFKKYVVIFTPIQFTMSILSQIALVILVIYPIVVNMARTRGRDSKLKSAVIRVALCTSGCIVTDVVFLLLKLIRPPGAAALYVAFWTNYNNTFIEIFVWLSFVDYKHRFFPFAK